MNIIAKLIFPCVAFAATNCIAEHGPCGFKTAHLIDNKIELQFEPHLLWDSFRHPLSPYVEYERGKLRRRSAKTNQLGELEPIQLENGEEISLSIPHISCTFKAVIKENSIGVLVRDSNARPIRQPATEYKFLLTNPPPTTGYKFFPAN